ncbi:MAG: glycosyltransferase family 4 protein [bacterium]|jgi:glycosyltransferase involved in cell wall biosynthesis|nr:glycosyltransferase family 4 protein [bacterium]
MKIAFVSLWAHQLFQPDDPQPYGGAELQLKLLTTALAQNPDLDVHMVTRGQGESRCYNYNGMTVHKLPYSPSAFQRKVGGTLALYKILVQLGADLYIQRGSGIETAVTGLAARRIDKAFLFMTASRWDVNGTHSAYIGHLAGLAYRLGLHWALGVVTQSNEQQAWLLRLYGKSSTVVRSAHPIPVDIPAAKHGILWISRCEPCKRPALFLDLAAAFPEHPFTMVCPLANDPALFESIQARAQTLPNLTFAARVPFEETERLFATHRLFVNTSDMEGFPNTFVQAAKWGTPILTLEVNPDHIITTEQIGYCAGGDFSQMKTSLRTLLDTPSAWQTSSQNGRRYARQNHDIHQIVTRLTDLMKNLIETNRSER